MNLRERKDILTKAVNLDYDEGLMPLNELFMKHAEIEQATLEDIEILEVLYLP